MAASEAHLWCDGSGVPDGPGGWGAVLICGEARQELCGGLLQATNNQAELTAAIKGLEALTRPCHVVVHTDSRYVCDAFRQDWIAGWKRKAWRGVKNRELWARLIEAVEAHVTVRWEWHKGHAGVTDNEVCDKLAGNCRKAILECIEFGLDPRELPFDIEDAEYDDLVAGPESTAFEPSRD
ncbi:MAG TPA: RNase H family protein [Solirubrobacteraceae bacterium]|nr:RNase H family protein [Solirubrobacteraceae bacterium]